ncbi:hypothetical protein [Shewanella marina]|uniref:hypothetical protein n=1 Tax=Shewanella marina TaxID=487319 RepID=UPI00046F8CE3|nr:hypothetical protein [Shewanella marina]
MRYLILLISLFGFNAFASFTITEFGAHRYCTKTIPEMGCNFDVGTTLNSKADIQCSKAYYNSDGSLIFNYSGADTFSIRCQSGVVRSAWARIKINCDKSDWDSSTMTCKNQHLSLSSVKKER